MKYSLMILALLLFVGIGFSTDLLVNASNFYCEANTTTYDWTLTKTADRTDLEFVPPPDPEAEAVEFTIDITRSESCSTAHIVSVGGISITNLGATSATITDVVDSIRYNLPLTPYWYYVHDTVLFSGTKVLLSGETWYLPFDIPFTTPYDLNYPNHANFVYVYTDDGGKFEDDDMNWFHDTPTVVNQTLYVWDEITVPPEFGYTWDYDGPWTVSGDAQFIINLSLTNVSATSGSYEVTNVGYGTNECGDWSSEVKINLHVTPPDGEWEGYTYTPGYWKNHTDAFDQWLPVTIAGQTITSVSQAVNVLKRQGASYNAWYKFLCHFLATKFNTLNDPGLLSAYYNDMTQTGEFMEGQTVAYIISVANTYTSSTPSQTLLDMKDVFDAINNNASEQVLWLTPQGGSGSSYSLPNSSFFTLSPNPFDNRTEIRFLTEVKEPVSLNVYDISGAKVRDLVKNGNSTLYWDGTDNNGRKLTRGVYIIRANNATLKALISR